MTTADPGRIDPALVIALHERHAGELRLFLTGVLRDPDLAAEALQNTFAKTVESGHTARPESLKGWLFQVAFHEALALRRRHLVRQRSLRELAQTEQRRLEASANEGPAGALQKTEMIERIRLALSELPAAQQQVVRMRIYEEKTFTVIAEELAAPIGTVLTRMRLALNKLARNLKSD